MAKNIDYSKIKAMASSILECIGEDEEGENPSLPDQDDAVNDGGVEPNTQFLKTDVSKESVTGVEGDKKKKKDASLAMMAATLSSKFNK